MACSCRNLGEFWSRSGLLTLKIGSKSLQNEASWLPKASKINKKSRSFLARVSGGEKVGCTISFGPIWGDIWAPFWEPKSFIFHVFVLASFFDGFWEASGCILGVILVDFWRYFLIHFPTLRKKPHPTNLLQIAVRSRVGRLKKGGQTIQKVSKIPFQN